MEVAVAAEQNTAKYKMVKSSVKYTLVLAVVGLLVVYIVLARYCNMERMEDGDAVAPPPTTSSGGKVPVPPPTPTETAYIILGLIGALIGAILLVIFAQYAFRSLSGPPAPPAYQASPYGARRR